MSEDASAVLNDNLGGWNAAMGLRFVRATDHEVVATWTVGDHHKQPYGIVHGGVHCGIIEAVCSTGAALSSIPNHRNVVGLDNHTSFVRAVRGGTLTVRATPITRGKTTQLWEATVTDEAGKTVATGRVRLLCVEADRPLGGEVPKT